MMLTPSQDKSNDFIYSNPSNQRATAPISEASQESSPSVDLRITIPTSIRESLRINNEENYAKQACFLRKICGMLASASVWVVLAQNDTDFNTKLESLFSIICCCVAYMTFENLFLCISQELPEDDHKERIFDVLDGILILYFLLNIMFCDQENSINKLFLVISPCLYLVLTNSYVRQLGREASGLKKCSKVTQRLLCAIQIWVVTAKILGYITLSWMTVFIPLGLLLLGYQIYGSYTLIKSAIQLFRKMDDYQTNPFSFAQKCVKISWYFFYCGFYPLSLVILLNLCQEAEHVQNEEFMRVVLRIAHYYCSFFLGYTLIFFRLMKKFDMDLSLENQEEEVRVEIQKKRLLVQVQKEGVIAFFKKMSPTFFVRAGKSAHKSQEDEEGEEMNDSRSTGIEESLCYICETNNPDIILADCGHGGMCKDCLLLSMKKNNKCMECRRPVKSVYQIKKEEVKTGTVEAVESFNIV